MYLDFFWRVGGIQFIYLKNFFEERLSSSSDSYKLGAQGKLHPHPEERRGVCLGHNKGSE